MKLFTIGFKGKSAETFFTALQEAGVQKLIDVRRSNASQLAGFTKGRDLPFFLRCLHIEYEHIPDLGPSDALLREYRSRLGHKKKDDDAWDDYVGRYTAELAAVPVTELFEKSASGFSAVCLLCSEEKPDRCHRRLLAERIASVVDGIEIVHL